MVHTTDRKGLAVTAKENKTERLHLLISPTEVAAIDDWGFKNRIRTKGEAVRRLCQIGLSFDRDGKVLLKRTERALKATVMTLDKIGKAVDEMPKGIRGGLAVVLEEQIAANKAALSTLVAAGVYADGLDHSEFENLIKRAEGYVEVLVNRDVGDVPAFMRAKP